MKDRIVTIEITETSSVEGTLLQATLRDTRQPGRPPVANAFIPTEVLQYGTDEFKRTLMNNTRLSLGTKLLKVELPS